MPEFRYQTKLSVADWLAQTLYSEKEAIFECGSMPEKAGMGKKHQTWTMKLCNSWQIIAIDMQTYGFSFTPWLHRINSPKLYTRKHTYFFVMKTNFFWDKSTKYLHCVTSADVSRVGNAIWNILSSVYMSTALHQCEYEQSNMTLQSSVYHYC